MKKMFAMLMMLLCMTAAGGALAETVSYVARSWNGSAVQETTTTVDEYTVVESVASGDRVE